MLGYLLQFQLHQSHIGLFSGYSRYDCCFVLLVWIHASCTLDGWIILLPMLVPPTRWLVVLGFLLLRIGRVVFCILAAIHLAILCIYLSVLVLVIGCLDYLSTYIPDFTHLTLHSLALGCGWRYKGVRLSVLPSCGNAPSHAHFYMRFRFPVFLVTILVSLRSY
ncbi:hypothetical protein Pse7429DRAFT_0157 [Pseudanabaena biceps PCC 7429]|uniref:Uncharacterized protein n=1 Tax=Pseudanabaena biceps PCC 7429 TaxID=927668 RepID=L8N7P5_9CYAN|nr:hypothetical protein Pse7429DRAFT_0157 [Pseudanabaena biceps PCC 7429]